MAAMAEAVVTVVVVEIVETESRAGEPA